MSDGAAGVIVEYAKGVLTVRHIEKPHPILVQRASSGAEWTGRIFPMLKGELTAEQRERLQAKVRSVFGGAK